MGSIAIIRACYSPFDLKAVDLHHEAWELCQPVVIDHYWSGALAPEGRRSEARLIWNDIALCIRFECEQAEPLIVNTKPETNTKTLGLWDRDVCEVFLAPNPDDPGHYFEFEAAPTGEWVDLAIRRVGNERETEWSLQSNMTTYCESSESALILMMRIPWSERIPRPQKEDEWRINLCRCVGRDPDRGYLIWQPTFTPKPNFHVPSAFGTLLFT